MTAGTSLAILASGFLYLSGCVLLVWCCLVYKRRNKPCKDAAVLTTTEETLRQANSDLQQFAYIASHDLKEPLRTIHNYVEILFEEHQIEGPNADLYKKYILEAAQRAQALVGDLLKFSRTGSKLSRSVFCLSEAIEASKIELNGSLHQGPCELTYDPLPSVEADKEMLTRLFSNIFSNSIKFSKKGKICKIHVSCSPTKGGVKVSVRDNGIGIDPKHLDVVFEAFRRLYSQSEFPGTGIGLALCRRIVHAHGGIIWADSKGPGKGTTVSFTLPHARPPDHNSDSIS